MTDARKYGPDFDLLEKQDPEIASILLAEIKRQQTGLQLIASENFTSGAVLAALGTPLSNKYAEGYPGKRYYGGCEVVDRAEEIAIERAKQLFGADHANVQPHSGASANIAVYAAFTKPGDKVMAMSLPPQTYQPDHLSGILLPCGMGNLILRGASCLDALSTYPVRT